MANQLVFIHGLESTAQGTKGQFFRQLFPQMIIEDYTGDFDTRMSKLSGLLAGRTDLILVGSSYGGLMASQYAMGNEGRVKKLILLAPALNLPEFRHPKHQPARNRRGESLGRGQLQGDSSCSYPQGARGESHRRCDS